MQTMLGLLKEIWNVLTEASIYILFGIFVAGIIQIFINKKTIAKHLGKKGFRSVFLAALFGVPLPLCSCGVLPTAISLRKNGASKGATLSFLISTPESSVDSIAISYALLDPIMTVFRPLAAFLTAMVAGISENIFGKDDKDKTVEPVCEHCEDDDKLLKDNANNIKEGRSFLQKLRSGMKYAFVDLLGDMSVWLMIGIIFAGIISYFVPESFFENYLGSGIESMLLMLLVGIPLYICATASTPIAAALIAKGMSPGVALVFLLVGPATNIAGMIVTGKFLGKKTLFIYLASISVCAVSLGLILNYIYVFYAIDVQATLGKAPKMLPESLKIFAALILIVLIGAQYFVLLLKRKASYR